MKPREYVKNDADGNFVKAYPTDSGWEIEINCWGKTLKYGASNCNRTFWDNRKQAVEAVDSILYKGIDTVYSDERRRQLGY